MIQEDKELLLKDLCARLPYGVICKTEKGDGHLVSINQTLFGTEYGLNINPLKRDYFNDGNTEEQVIKPYLRPMSSMTEEQKREYNTLLTDVPNYYYEYGDIVGGIESYDNWRSIDYLTANHFDYRDLIPKGLAIDATGLNVY